MIDMRKIGQDITAHKLWEKTLKEFSREEIETLAGIFFSSPGSKVPTDGWKKPYIDDQEILVIPHDCHPRYRWWTEHGQSIEATLVELGASIEMMARYIPEKGSISK